jgi:hypothetical protein
MREQVGFVHFPGLKIEISTPRTKTCPWEPRTGGTHEDPLIAKDAMNGAQPVRHGCMGHRPPGLAQGEWTDSKKL